MYRVLQDSITFDGNADGKLQLPYFTVSESKTIPLGISEEEEFALFLSYIQEARESGTRIHIDGVTTSKICDYIREEYEKLGYFFKPTNRFEVDFRSAPITLGCRFESLFSRKNNLPQRHTLHQFAVRKALNAGVISTITFEKNTRAQIEKSLATLLESEEFSPYRLGRLLAYNAIEIANQEKERQEATLSVEYFEVAIPKHH